MSGGTSSEGNAGGVPALVFYTGDTENPKRRVEVDSRQLMRLYSEGKSEKLSDKLLEILMLLAMRENTYLGISPAISSFVNAFVENFLYIMTREDFEIPQKHARIYILFNHVISNVIAMSDVGNSDREIGVLLRQKRNLVKILALLSRRNGIRIDPGAIFAADGSLATLWYWEYYIGSNITEEGIERIRAHMKALEVVGERLTGVPARTVTAPYFRSTYADPEGDRYVKERVNRVIRRTLSTVEVDNRPKGNRIAIITGKWFAESSVFRPQFRYVEALAEEYELILVHLGPKRDDLERSLFREVRFVAIDANGALDLSAIRQNDFRVAYYPDVGMTPESIFLSNLRLAPIQVTTYGHPVSTFGSTIDYFFGGVEAEIAEKAQQNYSERLVLLPGVGQFPVYPDYEVRGASKTREELIISCPWAGQKINFRMLRNLKEIMNRSKVPLLFRFFTVGEFDRWNFFVPSLREISSILGNQSIEVFPAKPYREYMGLVEDADISLDSFPFGGYNTMVDALFLKKPVVTFEGDRAYNRFASALLRRCGLDDLVATSDEQYIEKSARLINDQGYRRKVTGRVADLDLKAKLFETGETASFRKAMDYLVENHEKLKMSDCREPIVIT